MVNLTLIRNDLEMTNKDWSCAFDDPIPLPNGARRCAMPANVAAFPKLLRSSESPAAVFCPWRRERAEGVLIRSLRHLMAHTKSITLIVALSSLATDRLALKKTSAPARVSASAQGSHSAEVKLEMPILWGVAAAWVLQGDLCVPVLPSAAHRWRLSDPGSP